MTYFFLLVAVVTFPLMDLEVLQMGGRSLVLPWLAALLLPIPLLPRLPRAMRGLNRDRGLPLLLGWLAVCCLCSVWAYFRHMRLDVLEKNASQLANLALMVSQYALFAAALGLLAVPRLERLLRRMVDVATVGALYSLYQLAAFFLQWPGRDVLRTSTLYLRAQTLVDEGYGSWIDFPRPYGTAPEPSFWGGYLAVAAALVLGGMLVERRRGDRWRLLVLAMAMAVTLSRGVWLSACLLALAAAAFRWTPRAATRWLPWALVVVILITILPAFVGDRAEALMDPSSLERVSTHRRGLRIFVDHLLTGAGFGTIEFLAPQYSFVFPGYANLSLLVVHNTYLLVLASTGLVGGFFFFGFLRDLLRAVGAVLREAADPQWRRVRTQAAMAVLAVLFFWLNTPAYNLTFTWFALALAGAVSRPQARAPQAAALPMAAAAA